mmetsp:Transcript_94221/g.130863  ORF Transcript_94221/g.130863 Transcript_94221/m.130863 type:complete len:268 (+) Transcript_94221:104-907(+)
MTFVLCTSIFFPARANLGSMNAIAAAWLATEPPWSFAEALALVVIPSLPQTVQSWRDALALLVSSMPTLSWPGLPSAAMRHSLASMLALAPSSIAFSSPMTTQWERSTLLLPLISSEPRTMQRSMLTKPLEPFFTPYTIQLRSVTLAFAAPVSAWWDAGVPMTVFSTVSSALTPTSSSSAFSICSSSSSMCRRSHAALTAQTEHNRSGVCTFLPGARKKQQSSQKIFPQSLQWCLRRVRANLAVHLLQLDAVVSDSQWDLSAIFRVG